MKNQMWMTSTVPCKSRPIKIQTRAWRHYPCFVGLGPIKILIYLITLSYCDHHLNLSMSDLRFIELVDENLTSHRHTKTTSSCIEHITRGEHWAVCNEKTTVMQTFREIKSSERQTIWFILRLRTFCFSNLDGSSFVTFEYRQWIQS